MDLPKGMALMKPEPVPLHFYRYLYEQVGKAHHWLLRRELSDADLAAVPIATALNARAGVHDAALGRHEPEDGEATGGPGAGADLRDGAGRRRR